jgi:hypothetical protein
MRELRSEVIGGRRVRLLVDQQGRYTVTLSRSRSCQGVCSWLVWIAVTRRSIGESSCDQCRGAKPGLSHGLNPLSFFTVDQVYSFRKAQTSTVYLFVDLSKNPHLRQRRSHG